MWSIRHCALKKASLLSSSGGPLSRLRHVPLRKTCYCPMHLMPDVETSSLKTLGQLYKEVLLLVNAVSTKTGVKLHSQLTAARLVWVRCGLYHAIHEISFRENEFYGNSQNIQPSKITCYNYGEVADYDNSPLPLLMVNLTFKPFIL